MQCVCSACARRMQSSCLTVEADNKVSYKRACLWRAVAADSGLLLETATMFCSFRSDFPSMFWGPKPPGTAALCAVQ